MRCCSELGGGRTAACTVHPTGGRDPGPTQRDVMIRHAQATKKNRNPDQETIKGTTRIRNSGLPMQANNAARAPNSVC